VAEKFESFDNFEDGVRGIVRFCKRIALTARLLNSATELHLVYVSLMLQLTAEFKSTTWNNTTFDTVDNYHVDGGRVSFTVTSRTLIIRPYTSGCSGNLKV